MPIYLDSGNSYYYTDEYKTTIRSCKEILLAQATFLPFPDESIKFAYKNNFHKFLREYRTLLGGSGSFEEHLIWTISFINDIENPNADFSHLKGIWVITEVIIDSIIQINRVRRE